MDLGLDALTDDQLLELLDQACAQLSQREGYVRDMAQLTIVTGAERLKAKKKALSEAVEKVLSDDRRRIAVFIETEVRKEYAAGQLRLMTAGQEAAEVVKAEKEAMLKLAREVQGSAGDPKLRFFLDLQPGQIQMKYGSQVTTVRGPPPAAAVRELFDHVMQLVDL